MAAPGEEGQLRRDLLLVLAAGLLATLPFLGQTWDLGAREVRHAEVAREMAESGHFAVPHLFGEPYPDKPPVLHIPAALLYRLAGEPSFGLARLPSALAAVLAALALYGLGRLLSGRRAALLGAVGLLGTQLFARMARIARPDMLLTLGVVAGCLGLGYAMASQAVSAAEAEPAGGRRRRLARCGWMALGGLGCGLGTLAKGPYGLGFPLLFAALAPRGHTHTPLRRGAPGALGWTVFAVVFLAVLALWAVPAWQYDGGQYLRSVVLQRDLVSGAEHHARPVYYYAGPLLVALLPLTLFLPVVFVQARRRGLSASLLVGLAMLAILSAVPGKRAHYLLPALPLLVLAIAEAIAAETERRAWVGRAARWLIALGLLASPLYAGGIARWRHPEGEPIWALAQRVAATVPADAVLIVGSGVYEEVSFACRRTDVVLLEELAGRHHGTSRLRPPPAALWQELRDPAARRPAYLLAGEHQLGLAQELFGLDALQPLDVSGLLFSEREPWRLYRLRLPLALPAGTSAPGTGAGG